MNYPWRVFFKKETNRKPEEVRVSKNDWRFIKLILFPYGILLAILLIYTLFREFGF